jgi:hypothetical protein
LKGGRETFISEEYTLIATHPAPSLNKRVSGIITGGSIKEAAIGKGFITEEQFEQLVSPEAVCRLGSPMLMKKGTE